MRMPFFFVLLLLWSCSNQSANQPDNPPPPASPKTYLALGDSYTIGESVAEESRYPNQLASQLRDSGILMEAPLIIAKTGWRTDNLQDGIQAAELQDTFDLVSLLIGVNNQFQNRPISVYQTEFEELLQQAIAFAGGKKENVFVISIPDYAFTPYGQGTVNPNGISSGIDQFNAVNRSITEEYEIPYYFITAISRQGVEDTSLVASDGLHPSGEQYRRWVEVFFEDVLTLLSE